MMWLKNHINFLKQRHLWLSRGRVLKDVLRQWIAGVFQESCRSDLTKCFQAATSHLAGGFHPISQ